MKYIPAIIAAICLTACTTIEVRQVSASENRIKIIYILENPNAPTDEVLNSIETGIRRHGIEAKVIKSLPPSDKDYFLTYTAYNKWDLAPYLGHAELKLKRGSKVVGSATYHHHGGADLGKFGSVASKVDPLVDQLFAGFQ